MPHYLRQLSLRLRVFLFFCVLALGALGLAATALFISWTRAELELSSATFISALLIFGFLNTGLVLGVWLLFDEHVSKPIDKLSAELRLHAHCRLDTDVSMSSAQYLGDLAPAAGALTQVVNSSAIGAADRVLRETQRLKSDSEQLTALLSEVPVATILVNASLEIVLYDAQAAHILSQVAPPRLKAPLADYFEVDQLEAGTGASSRSLSKVLKLRDSTRALCFNASLRSIADGGHMIFIEPGAAASTVIEQRPLIFDFDLVKPTESKSFNDTVLSQLSYVSFDTETTGLSVEKDAVIQLGAVRVLNGRIVEGETFDTYVNPGCGIPPSSSKIHRIVDADVVDSPDIAHAGRAFYLFAKNSVLVAHNAPFDIGFLRKYQSQMGVEWNHPVLDTVLLSAVVFGTTETHSLDALCDRLSIHIPQDRRHTALGDAHATAEVLVKLLPLLMARGFRTFGELIRETRRHSRVLQDLNV